MVQNNFEENFNFLVEKCNSVTFEKFKDGEELRLRIEIENEREFEYRRVKLNSIEDIPQVCNSYVEYINGITKTPEADCDLKLVHLDIHPNWKFEGSEVKLAASPMKG